MPSERTIAKNIARTWDAEQRLSAEVVELRANARRLVAERGAAHLDAVLDGTKAPAPSDVDVEIATRLEAIEVARARRAELIGERRKLAAATVHDEAKAKRAEADATAAKAGQLLAELEKVEGCRFEPESLPNPSGVSIDGEGRSVPRLEAIPRSTVLRREADHIDAGAVQQAARPARGHAEAVVDTDQVELVVAAYVEAIDPADVIGAPLHEVHEWAATAIAKQVARRERVDVGSAGHRRGDQLAHRAHEAAKVEPVRVRIVSSDDHQLSASACRAWLPGLDEPGQWLRDAGLVDDEGFLIDHEAEAVMAEQVKAPTAQEVAARHAAMVEQVNERAADSTGRIQDYAA